MWHETSEFFLITIAVMLTAFAIKLVDDYLDREFDDTSNFAQKLGNGTMVYAILLMVFAAGINVQVSVTLFLASYIIGMFNDLKSIFPSKLKGWQESILVFIIGTMIFKFNLMMFAVLFVFSIQLIDDCIDTYIDSYTGQRNLANRIGKFECILLAILTMSISCWLNEKLFYPVLLATALAYSITVYVQSRYK